MEFYAEQKCILNIVMLMETGTIFEYDKKTKSYETHMI
jgi:hypothetical protein